LRSPPQNLTHLHQVSYFKISRMHNPALNIKTSRGERSDQALPGPPKTPNEVRGNKFSQRAPRLPLTEAMVGLSARSTPTRSPPGRLVSDWLTATVRSARTVIAIIIHLSPADRRMKSKPLPLKCSMPVVERH